MKFKKYTHAEKASTKMVLNPRIANLEAAKRHNNTHVVTKIVYGGHFSMSIVQHREAGNDIFQFNGALAAQINLGGSVLESIALIPDWGWD